MKKKSVKKKAVKKTIPKKKVSKKTVKNKVIKKKSVKKQELKNKSVGREIINKIREFPRKITKPIKNIKPKIDKFIESDKELEKVRFKNRVSSGIKNLDKLIEGGFTKNSTNLIVGSGGSGKSIFGVQFLVDGIKNGETGLYITFEEQKNEFYNNMRGLGFDLDALEKQGKFFLVEYTPEKVKKMLDEGGGVIESLILREKISRVVIDSISAFLLLFESDTEKRESSLGLFHLLRKWNCTSVLIYEEHLQMHKKVDFPVLEFESDAIIILYFVRKRQERERFIEILKMRGTNHSKQVHSFSIEKKGITVNTDEVSKIQDLYSDDKP